MTERGETMDDMLLHVFVHRLSIDGRPDGQAGQAALQLDDDTLVITPDAGPREMRPVRLPLGRLAGLAVGTHPDAPDALLLHPLQGVAIGILSRREEQRGDLLSIGRRAERRAYTLPELTRGLRAVGSRSGAPGDEHDRWFGGLLTARREAARADGWAAQVKAFAPHPLRRQLADTLTALAVARHPASAPDQRALVAALEEQALPLERALESMEAATGRLHSAADHERLVAWRAWVEATRHCFVAADQGWLAMTPLLAWHDPVESTGKSAAAGSRRGGSWWRRRGLDERAS